MKGFLRTSSPGSWSSTNCFPFISLHPRFAFNPSYPGAGPPPPQRLGLQNNGKFGVAWVIYRIQMQTQINPLGFKIELKRPTVGWKMGGWEGGVIPLGSYDLSDPKNPWIADRKRSTKSPIATSPPWSFMISDLVDHFLRRRWNYCTLKASFIHLPTEYGLSRGLFTLYSRVVMYSLDESE